MVPGFAGSCFFFYFIFLFGEPPNAEIDRFNGNHEIDQLLKGESSDFLVLAVSSNTMFLWWGVPHLEKPSISHREEAGSSRPPEGVLRPYSHQGCGITRGFSPLL